MTQHGHVTAARTCALREARAPAGADALDARATDDGVAGFARVLDGGAGRVDGLLRRALPAVHGVVHVARVGAVRR